MKITKHQADLLRAAWKLIEAAAAEPDDAKSLRVALRRVRDELRGVSQRAHRARGTCVGAWLWGWDLAQGRASVTPYELSAMRPGLVSAMFAGIRMRHRGGKNAQAAYDAAMEAFASKEATND